MGMITFTCAYEPCSKVVTYVKIGHGKLRKYCSDVCRNRNRNSQKRRREATAKFIARMTQRTAEFRAQGLCLVCGNPVVEGRLRCYEHLRYLRQYQRERRKKMRNA